MNNGKIAASIFTALALFESAFALYHSTSPTIEVLDAGVCALVAIAFAIQHLADTAKGYDGEE
jgi:hypothetical protein